MASQPNINKFEATRIKIDGNDPLIFIFTVDGKPVDVSSRSFVIRFSPPETTTKVLDIANSSLTDEPNGFSVNPYDFINTLRESSYTIWVFEEISTERFDVIAWGSFTWVTIPPTPDAAKPRKPSDIEIRETVAPGPTEVVYVYTVPNGGGTGTGTLAIRPFSSRDAIKTAPMPDGLTNADWVLAVVPSNAANESEFYFKRGSEIVGVNINQL